MNTTFFAKASGGGKALGWKDIFSDVMKKHRKDQRTSLLTKGMGTRIPAPNRMLTDWQKPWFFARVLLAGLVLSIVIGISCLIFAGSGMMVMLCMLPAFVVPLAAMFFYWEMNIPGDISLFEMLLLVLLGGILSLAVTGLEHFLVPNMSDIAFLTGPFPEELAKCLIVTLFLCRKKYTYGLQGIAVGGAVGVGFSAIETAGYVLNQCLALVGQETASNIIIAMALQALVRAVTALGGHVVWAALYGGVLALIKGKGKMGPKCFADSMFWMAFSAAFLLHTAWNFSVVYLQGILPDSTVLALYQFENGAITQWVRYIVLTVLAWLLLFSIMKKSIRQMVCVDRMYREASAEKKRQMTLHLEEKRVHAYQGNNMQQTASKPAGKQQAFSSKTDMQYVGRPVALVQCVSGALQGREYVLMSEGSLIFGRNSDKCSVKLPDGTKGVSGVHCKLTYRDGKVLLTDLNSSYGTYLGNGARLSPQQPCVIGDQETFYLASQETMFFVGLK